MAKRIGILLAAAAVVALPFLLRPPARGPDAGVAGPGAPVLTIVSPHNEAIRFEFERGFSRWHAARYGTPVRVEWVSIGGTTEISRYLTAEYSASARAWWRRQGRAWPPGAGEAMLAARPPEPVEEREGAREHAAELRALHEAFRAIDDPAAFGARVDLFFGGGQFDHARAHAQGLTVPPWPPDSPPPGLFRDADGRLLFPEALGGESWRSDTYFGCALSTFGIAYNPDRLADLGLAAAPARWEDLADPAYARRVAVADPTKSGSIAKAFEMIVHQQCARAVRAAGFSEADVDRFEAAIAAAGLPRGEMPPEVPSAYQAAVEQGWVNGVNLLRRISANARYFTDSAGQVPLDVAAGRAAAGLAIDFFARYQAEYSIGPDGQSRLRYVTPVGGSSVSADPISLLRGAPNREVAVRFIVFALGEEGQRLWTYRPGTPGGPERFALRRLPVRRDFYPSEDPVLHAAHRRHLEHAADDLADPAVDPYVLAETFIYRPRWTGRHFGVHRDLVRAMGLDASDELRRAWEAIREAGGPERVPTAVALFDALPDRPEPLTWRNAPDVLRRHERLDVLRDWTAFFRAQYRAAEAAARRGAP